MPLIDLIARDRLAEPLVRQRVELTAAAIGAVAVDELGRLHSPLHWHCVLPHVSLFSGKV